MKRLTIRTMIAVILMSCVSAKNSYIHLAFPDAPTLPALIEPERLCARDIQVLAQFYRDYEKYLKKIEVLKKEKNCKYFGIYIILVVYFASFFCYKGSI